MNLIKKAIAAILLLGTLTSAMAQSLPAGSIGTVQGNTANQFSNYSFNFTATATGSEYIGFAFRQDPAYWTFGNVGLTTGGGSNILVNGNLANGGPVTVSTNSGNQVIQAPANWGVWYQAGTYPAAAGSWSAGQWYDGAVGSFDGIYQGFTATQGTTYTITFRAMSNNVVDNNAIQLGVYAGACNNLSGLAAACSPNTASFNALAVPAQTVNAGNPSAPPVPDPNVTPPTPTLVSTANGTPTVTNSTADGSTTTTLASSRGTTTNVAVATLGVTAVATAITNSRGNQTAQTLNVNQNTTVTRTTPVTTVTTSTTPITTVTTLTTPRTVTTVTTPTYIDTYSDGSTVTRTGTPVTTTTTTNIVTTSTSVVNEVVTATANTNNVAVASTNKSYSTQVDQLSKLEDANKYLNYTLDSNVLDRNAIDDNRFNKQDRNTFYVIGDMSRTNKSNGYNLSGSTYGIGYDYQVNKDWIVGADFTRSESTLNGTYAGGNLNKDHVGLYSAYLYNDWILKNDLGYASNGYTTNHSLPELGLSNSGSTNGQDLWFNTRVYTPDVYGFRPFAGVRVENNRVNGLTESGSNLTAMTFGATNTTKTSTDVGLRYDTSLGNDWRFMSEYAYNSQNYNTAWASVGYMVDTNSVVRLKYGYATQNGYNVQSGMLEARVWF